MIRLLRLFLPALVFVFSLSLLASVAAADILVLEPIQDTSIYQGSATSSNGAGDHFFAGTTDNGNLMRSLVRFDVAGNIPPGSAIHSVSLQMHMSRTQDPESRTTSLHAIEAEWGEGFSDAVGEEGSGAPATPGDATWIHRLYPDESWLGAGGDFDPLASASTQVGGIGFYAWTSAGMVSDVEFWLADPSTNFGWLVRGDEGTTRTSKRFDSRSVDPSVERPRLTIDYTPPGSPSGVCCVPGEDCVLLDPGDCTAQGGTYQGDGTACVTTPCTGVPITIVIEPSRDNTMFEEGPGTLSNGAGEYFFAGMLDNGDKRRALLAFDLDAHLPEGSLVLEATLTLRRVFGGGEAHDQHLHRALKDWGEGASDAPGDEELGAPAEPGDATWLHHSYPDEFWDTPGGDFDPTPSASAFVAFEQFWSWSSQGMIDDLQAWLDDPSQNFGWVLIGKEFGTIRTRKRYASRESADLDYRPKLEITYSVPPPGPDLGLPPVPVPPENPITEEKRVLGKILFWEEQVSSDNSVACGTCHRPADGGVDPRVGTHPGFDLAFGTDDDIFGSPGIRRADSLGTFVPDSIFGSAVQVTGRASQNYFGGIWAPRGFWDGRADGTFLDPLTDEIAIGTGGALESQALVPILSDVEMAWEDRDWADVAAKLSGVTPLALATDLPADVAGVIAAHPTYPDLFSSAFGDGEITPVRIAFSIATYERTLVADQTPWDLYVDGDESALTADQQAGAEFVSNGPCGACHAPPVFTSDTFRNIGLRPPIEDPGRAGVTGNPDHRGRFKVPTLRNVGLRNRLMHTGHIEDVDDALAFYAMDGHPHYTENQDENVLGGISMTPLERVQIADFLVNGLTDPRVASEAFPFDRPTLASESPADVDPAESGVAPLRASAVPNPFRERVEIRYELEEPGEVDVDIFTADGRLVMLRRFEATAGPHAFAWNGQTVHGRDAVPGVYFVRIRTRSGEATGRLIRID